MKYSIITVCLNAETTIRDTIESVLSQDCQDYEYIIMDGCSRDKTIDIIQEYIVDKRILFFSQHDNGLYDAMNTAIEKSSGDYIIFMNSGDLFYDNYVLKDMKEELNSDFVYGNVVRVFENGKKLERYKNKKILFLLLMGKMMSHQVIFGRAAVLKEMKFNEEYTITADFDMIVRAYTSKRTFHYVDRIISVVENINGISSKSENLEKMREQDDKSLKRNLPLWYVLVFIPKFISRKIRSV